jgi:hypothetical protein
MCIPLDAEGYAMRTRRRFAADFKVRTMFSRREAQRSVSAAWRD